MSEVKLPDGITVIERGWLSSNNILIQGQGRTALVDSGYHTHAAQTVALVESVLGSRPLDLLLNTHLHSDHCGGNHFLQKRYPLMQTLIPGGQAAHVTAWDPAALSYLPTGQHCDPFAFQGLLSDGSEVQLGHMVWQVHGAPGHDPHSVVLFHEDSRTLISADALWENGFGVVFPELEGESAFSEVAATLDLIETLSPLLVIPGHGPAFISVARSIDSARRRLDKFVGNPKRHGEHAVKVLLKFKLLELQRVDRASFVAWAQSAPYMSIIRDRFFPDAELVTWIQGLLDSLVQSGAATLNGPIVANS